MMLVPILLIVLVYLLFSDGRKNIYIKGEDNAESILKERYVNGEIDEETFRKMRSVIKK
jgi:uncharacterized membrane protein